MAFTYRISSITLQTGSEILLPPSGVLVIVGPNSSGKSTLLRELSNQLINGVVPDRILLDRVKTDTSGSVDDLLLWLRENVSQEMRAPLGHEAQFKGLGGSISVSRAREAWRHAQNSGPLNDLAGFLMAQQFAESRLTLLGSSGFYDPLNDLPSNPLQFLYSDKELETTVADWVYDTFGLRVFLPRYGSNLELRIGELSQEVPPPPPPIELLREIASKRTITTEGDGVRAFVGILLNVMISRRHLVLIDEPEAFLHPPQARRLGQLLVRASHPDSQIIVATHSMDILQGILEEKSRPTTVVRLDKVADKFTAGMVEPLQIQETWSDPLLRYSNLLDGVFHAGVVLCEGDSDCRFYNAVISTALRGTAGSRDLLFTHVGGKARLAKALQQLRRFHVRAAVIADIDVLNDRPILKGLVLASGGSWAEVEADYDTLVAAVESLGITVPSVDATRAEILKQLNGLPGKQAVPDRVADSIKAAVSQKSQWNQLKRAGLAALPTGYEAAERLLKALQKHGIFVVPVGELERWVPISVSKQRWIVETLEGLHHERPSSMLASFLTSVSEHFDSAAT